MKKRTNPGALTEEEQFKKAVTKCRNCEHMKMAHSFLGLFKSIGRCMDVALLANGEYSSCKCSNWGSVDNLEYLVEVHDKKVTSKGNKKRG